MDNITQDQQMDIKFTHEEIKKAMRNTKTRTAPGFSGDTINLYRLIYAIAPNTLVNAINEYYNNQDIQQEEQATWIKDNKNNLCTKTRASKELNNRLQASINV